jgi:beta-glucosidase
MAKLTIEEKVALVTGAGFWNTAAIEGAGIRSIAVSDGPHGLRTIDGDGNLGSGVSVPATCFPPAAGLASSWNRDLVEEVGAAIGIEARTEGVAVVLGPGVNIKRSPLCGRNFEYFSEDPVVAGELGAAMVRGLQNTGVGASLKHFAVNNQETNRMTVSAEVDERTLRELYFRAFETIVTREQPWTVMCSYNKINGVFAAENHWLLSDILRQEWGFEGLVVSDWGAVDDRVAALKAGTDLEMPGPVGDSSRAILAAIKNASLAESVLDESVARVRRLVERSTPQNADYDENAHHALARRAAAESIVLLKNQDDILPLDPARPIAVIGEFARSPRIQGAGSSAVNPTRVDSALEVIRASTNAEFAPGYSLDPKAHHESSIDEALVSEAVALAAASESVVLFVGLPDGDESEGYDRTHIDLPTAQLALISAVTAANSRTIVVLTNGGVVSLEPWHDNAAAILEAWLLGQAGGSAIADVLFGRLNPSGRLAESIPFRLQDNPSYLNFPGDAKTVRYGEGLFVGYRYYESADVAVRYPFGYGLSYTTFDYSELHVSPSGLRVAVTVTNSGTVTGSEVVQLYVSAPTARVRSPRRELRDFRKISLNPGESARVQFELTRRAFSFYDVEAAQWIVDGGVYRVQIARSAHDIALDAVVKLWGSRPVVKLSLDSPVADWLANPVSGPLFRRAAGSASSSEGGVNVLDMIGSMPMRRLLRTPGIPLKASQLKLLLAVANNRVVSGIARLFRK